MKEEFLKYFPQHIQAILNEEDLNSNEEIRIRNNLPLILRFGQAQKILNYIINTEDINYIFQKNMRKFRILISKTNCKWLHNNKRRTSCWNSWNSSVRCKWTSC